MALDILITTSRITQDPVARDFIEYLKDHEQNANLQNAIVYYDFPAYSDYETVAHKPDVLIISKNHGVFAVRLYSENKNLQKYDWIDEIDESLGQFCSIFIGRLLKSRLLKSSLSTLKFPVIPIILGNISEEYDLVNSIFIKSFDGFKTSLAESSLDLNDDIITEIRSVLEGAKALTRPQRRIISNTEEQHFGVTIAQLESEIANFDQKQRRAALVNTTGPQRIRGLAGSGKTVILAMKAAYLHLSNPDDLILVTFFTRNLRNLLTNLITRFYRNYKEEDPDWNRIHVRHGWGGNNIPGTYSDTCKRLGVKPISFDEAREATDPFDYVCRQLLKQASVPCFYDHVLIDEGQDFPSGFYELCFALAKGTRDEKNIVWAYDELQNILNVKMRSPEELFGMDGNNEPRISLERAEGKLSFGTINDTVLSKCYRNQAEVLVIAHALGFGIYSDEIVQLLESREHWQDVGYEVQSEGELSVGTIVEILRPAENSPLSFNAIQKANIVKTFISDSLDNEVNWIVNEVKEFINGGLQPEDMLIISLDDRNARRNFSKISEELAIQGVSTNNITADPYNEPPFIMPNMVTLSTVYRAKGNEASVVFAMGINAIYLPTRSGRNKLFTAFTRTKAWLRVSGIGKGARLVCTEIDLARDNFPMLKFVMPDLSNIDLIQRDLSNKASRAKKLLEEYKAKARKMGLSEDDFLESIISED